MSIVIFGDLFTFPEGSAATNRVYTYAKGFLDNGINVHVICFTNDYLDQHEGVTNGIHYYQPFKQTVRSNSFVKRNYKKLVKYYNTYLLIRKINKNDKIIAINSWSNFLDTHLFAKLICMVAKAKLFIEVSEHPLRYYENGFLKKAQGKAKFYIESGIADGILCISHFLVNFHLSKGVKKEKLFLLPSTVDPERFMISGTSKVPYRYIGYFGSLTFLRDNVDVLIKAFAKFNSCYKDIHLVLGGFCTDAERESIVSLISELKIEDKVLLLGFISREEIIQYVTHADVLVMVRSNDPNTNASYPSKLSEFLASSRPVISVNVGEIGMYLKDGKDAFLIEPGNVEALAEKLHYVFENYETAVEVGKTGKQLTETVFNYKYQAKRMIGYINAN